MLQAPFGLRTVRCRGTLVKPVFLHAKSRRTLGFFQGVTER
jgi:hypothetical protein